jgi:hypothetical protein
VCKKIYIDSSHKKIPNEYIWVQNNPPENNVEPVPAKSELPSKQSTRK